MALLAAPGPAHDVSPRTALAWDMIDDALATGTITLGNGKTREVETPHLINLVKWLASLNTQKKKPTVTVPDAFANR